LYRVTETQSPCASVSSHSSYRHATTTILLRTVMPRERPLPDGQVRPVAIGCSALSGVLSPPPTTHYCPIHILCSTSVCVCVCVHSTRLYYYYINIIPAFVLVCICYASASDVAKALRRYRHRHLQSPTPMTRAHNVYRHI